MCVVYVLTVAAEYVDAPIVNYFKSESSVCREYEETQIN
jgi:hypothetical protein